MMSVGGGGTGSKPGWLVGLMGETFFGSCGSHEDRRKNEKNIFCLRCCLSICPHCLPSHRPHPLLQVRRYVYHDVVRLGDLDKLIDCSFIQPYTINGAKVIFLTQRVQTRSCKGSSYFCFNCDRILQEPFHFCSLTCKVNHLLYQAGGSLSGILRMFDESEFTISQFEGLRMDGGGLYDVVVEEDGDFPSNSIQENTSSSTPHHRHGSSSSSECELPAAAASPANTKRSRKKKGMISGGGAGGGFIPGMVMSLGNGGNANRRKGAPHRAPFS
ncbi:hypothetical protein MLD38_009921 [Melastoma candidum]|uniref:Uncharacterized protein n=1 Tax=Melastoma candidum TaxID=119954 RepID=A0ACB9QXN7_9MYRT|nr:hypothetical protein MLD38_009921 [Melastoma candidum]